jgi:ATP-dependent Clp protease protease subunit
MHCAGYALSGGMMLFVAGSHRTCGKHSVFMYHDVPMTFNFSPLASIQEEVDHGRVVMNMINDLIVENTRIPREKLDEVRDKRPNWWITAQEALKLGIVEEVL